MCVLLEEKWKELWKEQEFIFLEDSKMLIFDFVTIQNSLPVSRLLSNEDDVLSKRQFKIQVIVIIIADWYRFFFFFHEKRSTEKD